MVSLVSRSLGLASRRGLVASETTVDSSTRTRVQISSLCNDGGPRRAILAGRRRCRVADHVIVVHPLRYLGACGSRCT
ncbi:hypothetical protein [Kibdelosporangium philippinense]|uniref:hypothetical protein n=1 Tax=Kibdelosporangium philippinense TaxID=211113 RepID=UPI00361FF75B